MTRDPVLAVGVMMTVGLLAGLLARRLKFPRITGYIIIGILLSPSVLNLVPRTTLDSLDIITSFALGIIAYAIGGSLRLESIRKLGRSVAWVTIAESLGALIAVTLLIAFIGPHILEIPNATFLHSYFPMALIIGAAVCPAAPAVTLAVIRELRARGPLTATLLAVVALDDAIGVVVFAIALGVALPLMAGAGGMSLYQMLGIPSLEIVKSIGIGAAFGFALIYMAKLARTRGLLLVVVLGMILLCIGVTDYLGISFILASMVVGFVVRNRIEESDPFVVVGGIEDVVFAAFFVLAGMHFDAGVMRTAGILALLIFVGRFAGKYFGVKASAEMSQAPGVVRKYLGFALLPEAGVTIGLALRAKSVIPDPTFSSILLNGILASVILNEVVAPPLTRYAILRAGEAGEAVEPAPEK